VTSPCGQKPVGFLGVAEDRSGIHEPSEMAVSRWASQLAGEHVEPMLGAQVTFGGILLVALVSAFLPVPMAFDVAIAFIAWRSGMPLPHAVKILCTLGIVSVYSLSVVGKSLSWRITAAANATVAALGTLAGLLARFIA